MATAPQKTVAMSLPSEGNTAAKFLDGLLSKVVATFFGEATGPEVEPLLSLQDRKPLL